MVHAEASHVQAAYTLETTNRAHFDTKK